LQAKYTFMVAVPTFTTVRADSSGTDSVECGGTLPTINIM